MEREDLKVLLRGYVEGESLYDVLSELSPTQLAAVNQLLRPRVHPDATRPGSQQWDDLQSDLEHREAALGRALSLLRAVWDESGEGTGVLVSRVPGGANHWPDVLRWVSSEPKEEKTVSDETDTPRVMETANPSERAAAGVDESLARWRGFSDEELRELRFGAIDREDRRALPAEHRERAGRLATELRNVLEARKAERSTYRGPGRYRHCRGGVFDVLGRVPAHEQVILREPGAAPGRLLTEKMTDFEDRDYDGSRLYEYLGPLEGEIS